MTSALSPLLLSLKVALWGSLLIVPPGFLLGLALARASFRGKSLLETVIHLPVVLPPTAIGYLLLRLLARNGPLGPATLGVDLQVLFTWRAAAIASAVMALPLVARTARVAFDGVDPRLEQIARTLGLGRARTFIAITLPLARRGLGAAAMLGFARALGEFGATIVVAGNIPGQTQTLPLAIFSELQLGRDPEALALVGVTVLVAFASIWIVERLLRPRGAAR